MDITIEDILEDMRKHPLFTTDENNRLNIINQKKVPTKINV